MQFKWTFKRKYLNGTARECTERKASRLCSEYLTLFSVTMTTSDALRKLLNVHTAAISFFVLFGEIQCAILYAFSKIFDDLND